MKTAMTELIEKVQHAISYNVEGSQVKKYTWEELSHDMYSLLEKEKWQIVSAINETKINIRHSSNYSGEEYYNQFYNL